VVEPGDELSDELREALQREAQDLRGADVAETSFGTLKEALGRETGLRAWLSSRSTRTRITTMLLVIVVTSLAVLRFSAREDLADSKTRVAFAALIYGCAVIAALNMAMRPLHRPGWSVGTARLVIAAGLGGAVGLALLPLAAGIPLSSPGVPFAHGATSCFVWGKALAVPLLALGWLMQRGGTERAGRLLITGGAAGLAANLYLECHCRIQNPDHLVMGHVTVIFATLLVGFLLSLGGRTRDGPGHSNKKDPAAM